MLIYQYVVHLYDISKQTCMHLSLAGLIPAAVSYCDDGAGPRFSICMHVMKTLDFSALWQTHRLPPVNEAMPAPGPFPSLSNIREADTWRVVVLNHCQVNYRALHLERDKASPRYRPLLFISRSKQVQTETERQRLKLRTSAMTTAAATTFQP